MKLKAQFRGLNSTLYANATPSGTCTSTLNTIVVGNTTVKGRAGFGVFNSKITGANVSLTNILNMTTATFANGNTYVVAKCADGYLYYRLSTDAVGANWTQIADKWAAHHNTSDKGWFYFWGDRLYYFDRVGGTKWHPTAGVWKAGIAAPTAGPTVSSAVAAGCAKEGYYHIRTAGRNSVTQETSQVGTAGIGGTVRASAGQAMVVTNVAGSLPDTTNYECDQVVYYCSMGNTEAVFATAVFSFENYEDRVVAATGAGYLYEADHIIGTRPRFTNAGGLPPGSRIGLFNGSQAVYCDVYPHPADTSVLGKVMFSVPLYPTMVPQKVNYSHGSDTKFFHPKPWTGEIIAGVNGKVTACGAVGARFIVFAANATYALLPMSDGKLYPTTIDPANGCLSEGGAVTTQRAVHAIGHGTWLLATEQGITDVSQYRFSTTLDTIPAAYRNLTVGGYYSAEDQVWMAVTKSTGTVPQRILIFEEGKSELISIFDPGNLSTAGIRAMCELSSATQAPIMLVALSDGQILKYPDTNYFDTVTGGSNVNYTTHWEGVFAQEMRAQSHNLRRVVASMETNAGGVTMKIVGLQTAAETTTPVSKTVSGTNQIDVAGPIDFDPYARASMYKFRVESDATQTAAWSLADLWMHIESEKEAA